MASAKAARSAFKMAFRPCGPLNDLPSGSVPDESIGNLPSYVRHAPVASKFSSPKPSGSIRAWQEAHVVFFLCCSNCSRSEADWPIPDSSRLGTSGGGGGGGAFRKFSSIHFPRRTGEVRVA